MLLVCFVVMRFGLAGTFWWHAHLGTEYIDGLRGPLIITDSEPESGKSLIKSHVIFLADWYHTVAANLLPFYLSPESRGNEPQPNSGLINSYGQSSWNCFDSVRATSSQIMLLVTYCLTNYYVMFAVRGNSPIVQVHKSVDFSSTNV